MIGARTRGWIGVDLGSHAVKLAQVERRGTALRLVGALVVRRTDPWLTADAAGPLASSDEIRAALSMCSDFAGRSAAAVLPMNVCDVRECKHAAEDESESRLLVRRELDTVYGDTEATHEFDYCPVGLIGDDHSESSAIAFSVRRDLANQVASDFSNCGLSGQVLDGVPWAIARAVEMSGVGRSPEPVAALDWGCGRATFCIVKAGVPQYVRCLRDATFGSALEAVQQAFSIRSEEAQKVLTDHGLRDRLNRAADEIQSVLEDVLAESLYALTGELERTLAFLRQQRSQLSPAQMLLFGGGAAIRNIDQFLAEKAGVPVDVWSLPMLDDSSKQTPWPLLGSAIALSSLAWAKS